MEISCTSLMCHEELFAPPTPQPPSSSPCNLEEYADVQAGECCDVLQNYMQREQNYSAGLDGYADRLRSSSDLSEARFLGVRWILLAGLRLSLSHKTAFAAVNYFDRFLSSTRPSRKWQAWMAELTCLACLSIASKLEEVCHPTFDEYQRGDFGSEKKFDPETIKQMELLVLKVLDWKLSCVTSYSYVELLGGHLGSTLIARISDLLIPTLFDSKFIEHNPSVVALSVLRYAVKEISPVRLDAPFSFLERLISEECKEKLSVCSTIVEDHCAQTWR